MDRLGKRLKNYQLGSVLLGAALILFTGCAKERDVKPVIGNSSRIAKTALAGTYAFLKTISEVKYPEKDHSWLAPGMHQESDKLVQFVISETKLDIVAIDPTYSTETMAERTRLLASFPVKHVDVLRKQNADGDDTNEEEETSTRKEWKDRAYIVIDLAGDTQDEFKAADIKSSRAGENIVVNEQEGNIQFDVAKVLSDDTQITTRYSLLRFTPSSTYVQKDYPRELQDRFGFFKTSTYKFDKFGRATRPGLSEFMNRWDTSKPVVYYLSAGFPEHLKPVAKEVFAKWNAALKAAVGHDVLELRENSGQEIGDLRYSMIVYDDSPATRHGILGYGPSFTNPRTGEIIKADVFLYGAVLKKSVYGERMWANLLGERLTPPTLGGMPAVLSSPAALFEGLTSPFEKMATKAGALEIANMHDSAIASNPALQIDGAKMLDAMRSSAISDLSKRITRISEATLAAIIDKQKDQNLSDEDLEKVIFLPLLTHELGHNLGLRHNFLGSADKFHFGITNQSASVMDYGFLSSHEPEGPGSYDIAAIAVGYGSDEKVTATAVAENYYYCTDESVFDSRNALCMQHDAGTTLVELTQNLRRRYEGSWAFNNLLMDRVSFGMDEDEYAARVMRFLMPLRLVYDNAQATMSAAEAGSLPNLWSLVRQRIEADPRSKPEDVKAITVTESFTVEVAPKSLKLVTKEVEKKLDMSKVKAVIKDASEAKLQSFQALAMVVLNNNRPMYDAADTVYNEVSIRGVIMDKIFSLILIGSRTANPLGDGTSINMFTTLPDGVAATFFGSLISGTMPAQDEQGKVIYKLKPFDANLRELSLNLLTRNLAKTGVSPESRHLLTVERIDVPVEQIEEVLGAKTLLERRDALKAQLVAAKDDAAFDLVIAGLKSLGLKNADGADVEIPVDGIKAAWKAGNADLLVELFTPVEARLKALTDGASAELSRGIAIAALRAKTREAMRTMYQAGATEDQIKTAQATIKALGVERAKINWVYTGLLGDHQLKAPVTRTDYGFDTASGHLIRDNINQVEDIQTALDEQIATDKAVRDEEMAKAAAEKRAPDIAKILPLDINVQQNSDMAAGLTRYLANEKLFAERLDGIYNPN